MEFIAVKITLPIIDPNFEQETSILVFCRLLHTFRSVNWKNIPQHEGILEWLWKTLCTDWSDISGRYIIFPKGEFAPKLLKSQTEISRLYFETGVSATFQAEVRIPRALRPPPHEGIDGTTEACCRRGKKPEGTGQVVLWRAPKRNDWSNLYPKWWFSKGILPKMAFIQVIGRWWF